VSTAAGFPYLRRIARVAATTLRVLTGVALIIVLVPILILLNVKADDVNVLREYAEHKSACLNAPHGTLNLSSCRQAMEMFCEVQRRQLMPDAPVPPHCQ